jgi:hypothetical protein
MNSSPPKFPPTIRDLYRVRRLGHRYLTCSIVGRIAGQYAAYLRSKHLKSLTLIWC